MSSLLQTPSCNHEPELEALKSSLKDAESDIAVLRMENQDLRERVEGLMMELSVKEAEWCETEEALNLKVIVQPVNLRLCIIWINLHAVPYFIFAVETAVGREIPGMDGRDREEIS